MSEELESIIEQTINGAISTIPAYMDEIKQNKETLKVEDPKEFVYGMIMGMALGMSGAVLSAQKEAPTILALRLAEMYVKYISIATMTTEIIAITFLL